MESPQGRKRKQQARIHKPAYAKLFPVRSLTICLSFFVFVLFISSDRLPVHKGVSIRPVLRTSTLSLLPAFLTGNGGAGATNCVYYDLVLEQAVLRPVLSVDEYHQFKSIVRCHLPPLNFSASVNLRGRQRGRLGSVVVERRDWLLRHNQSVVPSWDRVVYEAVLDWNAPIRNVAVFAKGLNLKPHREADARKFRCHFSLTDFDEHHRGLFVFTTRAISAAQETVRCLLPRGILNNPEKAKDIQVTVSRRGDDNGAGDAPLPSIAKVQNTISRQGKSGRGKYELCACTMLWNQAAFLREWIAYHSWLGIERWFIYDNNSDDELEEVIDELNLLDYNITRHAWPWVKTQEAGFSHCALRAKHECKWLGLFDVDEFFYFPHDRGQDIPGPNSLRALVMNYTDSPTYAEIRTACHSYGPSGLTSPPTQGVTVGYTCRLEAPERHKSIVRPELLHTTLLNAVHHFRLQDGYRYLDLPESKAVVNHYKYQAWDTFKAKFFRRVSTYVTNWQEDQNKGSKDRAPGLGTEAIEPPNWRLRFCEVWDTGLKDFVMANFADSASGFLPWERSLV
ncbi:GLYCOSYLTRANSFERASE FAMILY 92 PROTEIN [Salix koriyanagi]|uniref:Glycosyltransferase family 92 protein n=1 Tax=Salix koriyanagi TaxID=2511006 RepID=A0A9Q0WPH6_9ROSI|nr:GLYCOSYLTRANSFERASE FAMILY 92 PROTEIN [Salix koriyanagi]